MRKIWLLGLLALLLGCSAPTTREQTIDELVAQRNVQTFFPLPSKTYASFDAGHGYQLEYLSSNGLAYLWYPGNQRVVLGEWKGVLDEICYKYGSNTVNSQTVQRGGSWECTFVGRLQTFTVGYAEGDLFELQSGNVPYVRSKCDLPEGIRRLKKVSCSP